jgi:hypothetical protein
MIRKPIAQIISITALLLTISIPVLAYDLQSTAADMDNYFVPAFPVIYGEIIDRLPADEMKDISKVLKVVDALNTLKAVGDIGSKLGGGDNSGAALDTATVAVGLAINKFKDEVTKKIILGSVSVGAFPLTLLATTLDITRKSYEAVAASQSALDLERFSSSILRDPVLKTKGRKLGEGEPILITKSTVEHLWRKVLMDEQWRGLFKNYVTNQFGADAWPEPTTWERWTISSDHLVEAKLLEEKTTLKNHIAGMLKEMGKVVQKEEARVILAQQMAEVAAVAGKLSPEELEKALRGYHRALQELPVIETYAGTLPGLITSYSDRIGKVPKTSVLELINIREKEIMAELRIISSRAQVVRLLPSVGRNAAKRQELLTTLQKSYVNLAGLLNAASRAEINARLIAESKKLEVAGTEFPFTRHECTKVFEDVNSSFDSKVVSGAADAGTAVSKAKSDISSILEKLVKDYSKDFTENFQRYNEKLLELMEQQRLLAERLAQTSDYQQQAALRQAINLLDKQIIALKDRFEAYRQLHVVNLEVDTESCQGALTEIAVFVHENSDRQRIVLASLTAAYKDASDKYSAFYTSNQSPSRQILSAEELERLEGIIRDNPDNYAGLSFEFLKKHFVNEKDAPRSRNIMQSVSGMADALMTYSNALYSYRMPYYTDWERRTIPSLNYMESVEAREAVKVVLAAIDAATSTLRSTNLSDFPVSSKASYDQMLEQLRSMRGGIERDEELFSKAGASGLSGRLEAYNDKALRNNSQIAEDSAQLGPVLRAFHRAKQSTSVTVAMFMIESKDYPFKVLTSGPLVKILEESEVLFHSKRLGLGIEELVREPFLEMQGKNGLVDIYAADFTSAISKVQSAPVNEYGLFFQKLYAVADEPGGIGVVMGLLLRSGNTFANIFQDDPKLGGQATKLYTLFVERAELARKNQSIIDERKARFDMVLNRVNQLIRPMQEKYDAGDYLGVAGYSSFIGDVRLEYEALGVTRQDVDDAFAKLEKLVDDARSKGPATAAGISGSPAELQAVRDFYTRFREAYEARDDSRIMSYMGDDWEAGDGTTLSDMQANLSRMFRKFDEMKMDIQNVQINPVPQGFMVSYDVTITSRIYKKNLRHQEKSAVSELVSFGSNGPPRIVKTLNGRYWLVE